MKGIRKELRVAVSKAVFRFAGSVNIAFYYTRKRQADTNRHRLGFQTHGERLWGHYFDLADHNMNTILQNRGVKFLIFSGIDTAVCVDSTLRDAFHRGYYVVLARDICGSDQPERHEMAVKSIGAYYGLVATTKEIMQIWDRVK